MKYQSANKLRAFSLVEVIIASLIMSMGILLISNFLIPLHRQFTSDKGVKENIRWEKFMISFESDTLQLR